MRKFRPTLLLLLVVWVENNSLAQEIPLDINSLPIIPIKLVGGNEDARVKAQTAFFVQTGVSAKIQTVKTVVGRQIAKAKDRVMLFVDTNTPINSRTLLLVVGTTHSILVDKNFRVSVPSPWFKRTTHTFYWQPDQYQVDLSVHF